MFGGFCLFVLVTENKGPWLPGVPVPVRGLPPLPRGRDTGALCRSPNQNSEGGQRKSHEIGQLPQTKQKEEVGFSSGKSSCSDLGCLFC